MPREYRRVVTGHTLEGKSTVLFDTSLPLAEPANGKGADAEVARHGMASSVTWTTQDFPSDNNGSYDQGLQKVPTAPDYGTVFQLVRYSLGVTPRHHRTNSIDYAIVLSGAIDLELDTQTVKHKTGDVLVHEEPFTTGSITGPSRA